MTEPSRWAGRCTRCRHGKTTHGTDRKGRPVCWFATCGCDRFEPETPIPARLDERYDPSPEPINRSIQ